MIYRYYHCYSLFTWPTSPGSSWEDVQVEIVRDFKRVACPGQYVEVEVNYDLGGFLVTTDDQGTVLERIALEQEEEVGYVPNIVAGRQLQGRG